MVTRIKLRPYAGRSFFITKGNKKTCRAGCLHPAVENIFGWLRAARPTIIFERGDFMKHIGTRELETERLLLRKISVNDAEAMYNNWASDDIVTKYVTWPTHKSVEDTKGLLTMWVKEYENKAKKK